PDRARQHRPVPRPGQLLGSDPDGPADAPRARLLPGPRPAGAPADDGRRLRGGEAARGRARCGGPRSELMSATAVLGARPPTVSIGGRRYPVLLPRLSDARLHLAAVIVSLQILGQAAFAF